MTKGLAYVTIVTIILVNVINKKFYKRKVKKMKKLLSVLLALTFVLSMGVMALAAETTLSPEEQVSQFIDDAAKKIAKEVEDYLKGPEFAKLLADAKDAAKRVMDDPDAMAEIADETVAKISAATGMNVEEVQKAIADSGLFDGFAKLYMPATPVTTTTTKPETTTIVATGSAAGGLAIFATLSVAAAAAFVCIKKN